MLVPTTPHTLLIRLKEKNGVLFKGAATTGTAPSAGSNAQGRNTGALLQERDRWRKRKPYICSRLPAVEGR